MKTILATLVLCIAAGGTVRAATPLPATADALAKEMHGHRVVLLGEVHDNGAQHALRLAALKVLVAGGARPAIAFEQFDRERQPDIDRARRERPGDVDFLVAQAKGAPSWNWTFYKPFVALALEYDLPIVAANLSRSDAMKVATGAMSLPEAAMAPAFVHAHEAVIARGHCDLLPADALPGMARAQIARDRTLADAIRPHAARGVVLLAGNGHVRNDLGVPHWLDAAERAAAVSIGLLEAGGDEPFAQFDFHVVTTRAERADPCVDLRKRLQPKAAG